MGLPGSGKSYFARHLSQRLDFQYIGSDQIRKEMEALEKYNMEAKEQVYNHMKSSAANVLQQGKSVLLDATFFKEKLRRRFISLAIEQTVSYVLFWIEAQEELIQDRLSRKREDSEADYEVYLKLSKQFEPPLYPHLKLESRDDNILGMLEEAEEYIQHLP